VALFCEQKGTNKKILIFALFGDFDCGINNGDQDKLKDV